MVVRITCPSCQTSLKLGEEKRGRKVRCSGCEKVLNVPAANGAKRKTDDEEEVQEERKVKVKTVPEPEAEEEDRPFKKKKKGKKAKKGSSPVLLLGIAGVSLALLVAGGVSAYFLFRSAPQTPRENQQAKVDVKDKNEAPPPAPAIRIAPRIEEGSPTKKGGTGIVNNVRGAVYRTERKSELHSLGLSYQLFYDEYKGAARTYENFLQYIKRDGPIYEAVKEGYYKINMKAKLPSNDIIAYERDIDMTGHLCVRVGGDIGYVPLPELKAALGLP
jgi:predicted Zn finger-like uncharacterized protein